MNDFTRRGFAGLTLGCAAVWAGAASAQQVRVTGGGIGGATQAVIGSFTVAFLTERRDTARAGGGLLGGGFGGRSTARSALEGVGDAEFQSATDAAYADFVNQLAAAGVTVIDRAAALEAFRRSNASPLENGMERDVILARDSRAKAKVFSPTALGGLWLPREVLGQISAPGFSGNRSAIGFSMGGTQYARSAGHPILNAFYVVDFANADTYGGWFRNSSAVSVQAGLALVPEVSKTFAYGANGRVVEAILREPVAVGGDFGEFGDTTSGGHRAAELATNVIGVLGGVGTNSTRRYTMQAVPERWTAGVAELSRDGNARLIQALRTGR